MQEKKETLDHHELLKKNPLHLLWKPLLKWYDENARTLPWREDPTPYHVWVSEVMLQQTRVEAVKPYYARFLSALPTIQVLAEAEEEKLHKLWEGLGYYNRVRNMQKAAKQVCKEHHGQLPDSYEALLKLPGIGEYTAGAIASIAFGLPVPAVDGNVLRILTRMTACDDDILKPSVKKGFRELVFEILPQKRPGDFNQAMMELGATICVPNAAPSCKICPVLSFCLAYKAGNPTAYPVKSAKKPRRIEEKTVLLLIWKDRMFLKKRPQKGLLPGLWEYCCLDGKLSREEVTAWLQEKQLHDSQIYSLKQAKHIFTHVEWRMDGYLIALNHLDAELFKEGIFATKEQLAGQYAIPSAYRSFTDVLGQWL